MEINLDKASFKTFENIPGVGPYKWAAAFGNYVDHQHQQGHWNYRMEAISGCGPVVRLAEDPDKQFISLVSNDYLGFTQHPEVKATAIAAIEKFGTGAGSSPAIGGHYCYHREIEDDIAAFCHKEAAIIFTTGYTTNSSSIQALMKKEDLAILDMSVHASVQEGCQLTNVKTYLHNNLDALEMILKNSKDKYRTKMLVVDGVYSQDGDLAPLKQIIELKNHYGAILVVDDAHGTGVIGKTGRGVIELENLFDQVDIITGTFSKTFGHVGGYLAADPELIQFLKFQSRQHIFSATASPAAHCITKSIALIDEEPFWMEKLWKNINYFKSGLISLGLNVGNTQSAIVPVKIGDNWTNAEACRLLHEAGIYANQINYPAVSLKDARVRQSIMATHEFEHLDQVLNAWEWVAKKLNLPRNLN